MSRRRIHRGKINYHLLLEVDVCLCVVVVSLLIIIDGIAIFVTVEISFLHFTDATMCVHASLRARVRGRVRLSTHTKPMSL